MKLSTVAAACHAAARRMALLALAAGLGVVGLVVTPAPAHADDALVVMWQDNWPHAILPGKTFTLRMGFGNTSTHSTKVTVQPRPMCIDKTGVFVEFGPAAVTRTVPGNTSDNKNAVVLVIKEKITIPSWCKASRTLMSIASFTAVGGIDVTVNGAATGSYPLLWNIYGPYSNGWYKYNLEARAGRPSFKADAHHTLPQKHRTDFVKAGLNIDNPRYLRWWCSKAGVKTNHQSNSAAYNKLWKKFFNKYPKPSAVQVLAYRAAIQPKFTYTC